MESVMLALAVSPALISHREERVGVLTVRAEQSDGRETVATFPVRGADLVGLLETHRLRCKSSKKRPSAENGCASLEDIERESDDAASGPIRTVRAAATKRR